MKIVVEKINPKIWTIRKIFITKTFLVTRIGTTKSIIIVLLYVSQFAKNILAINIALPNCITCGHLVFVYIW